jgi:hypothetical protein
LLYGRHKRTFTNAVYQPKGDTSKAQSEPKYSNYRVNKHAYKTNYLRQETDKKPSTGLYSLNASEHPNIRSYASVYQKV